MQVLFLLYFSFHACALKLQAPRVPSREWVAEGGEFANFFKNRTTGRGIHKLTQYFPAYHRHFQKFIGKEVHIVEIGIQSGGSLEMWKAVFGPQAHVYGVDINKATQSYADAQTQIHIGSQEDPEFWEKFKKQVPRVDILIDDGGHTTQQQLVTLAQMLPHLSQNGVYMTEDILPTITNFWSQLPYDLLNMHAGSLHIYPWLFVAERDAVPNLFQHLGTTSTIIFQSDKISTDFQSIFTDMGRSSAKTTIVPDSCIKTEDEIVPKIKCLESIPPQSALVAEYDSKPEGTLSLSRPVIEQSMDLQFKSREKCCSNPKPNNFQLEVDSAHIYPRFAIFKKTADVDRPIQDIKVGTEWIPYLNGQYAFDKISNDDVRGLH